MRHRLKGKKLNRNTKQRQALLKGLIQSLILHQQIKTTETKAKAVKGLFDKLISQAKSGSLSARRQVLAFLPNKRAVHQLFDVLAPRTKDRSSGFTRFVRLGRRRGDNAMMVRLELVDQPAPKPTTDKGKKAPKTTPRQPGKADQGQPGKLSQPDQPETTKPTPITERIKGGLRSKFVRTTSK